MKTFSFIILVISTVLLFACKGEQSPDPKTAKQAEPETEVLPPLPVEDFQQLRQSTNYIDIIFNTWPLSISVDRQNEVQTFFQFFAPEPFPNYERCTNEGTIAMLSDGSLIGEAHIYFGQDCNGFVFVQDGKPYASMRMNNMGINYFKQIMNSAKQMRRQMQQQSGQ